MQTTNLTNEEIYEALTIAMQRIEAAGASKELTDAVVIVGDIRRAIGNKYNPSSLESVLWVRCKIENENKLSIDRSSPICENASLNKALEFVKIADEKARKDRINRLIGERAEMCRELDLNIDDLEIDESNNRIKFKDCKYYLKIRRRGYECGSKFLMGGGREECSVYSLLDIGCYFAFNEQKNV